MNNQSATCPCCGEQILYKMVNGKIVFLEANELEISEEEKSLILKELNIEFG